MQDDEEYDYTFNILLVGDNSSGKLSILYRLAENYGDNDFASKIGVNYVNIKI